TLAGVKKCTRGILTLAAVLARPRPRFGVRSIGYCLDDQVAVGSGCHVVAGPSAVQRRGRCYCGPALHVLRDHASKSPSVVTSRTCAYCCQARSHMRSHSATKDPTICGG